MGLVPLLEVLPGQHSLQELELEWFLSHPGEFLEKLEEAVKEWVQSVVVRGNSLIRYLEYSQVVMLKIGINLRNSWYTSTIMLITPRNSNLCQFGKRKKIPAFNFYISCYI